MSEHDAPTGGESRSAGIEDWLATIVGLVLLLLVVAGVIPAGLIP